MGVSHLLEHMVFKGTPNRSALEIAQSLERLGGSLDAYTAREHTSFQARILSEHLPAAAAVMCDLIFRPLLRPADLELERNVVLEEIGMVEDTPDDLVFELHNELLWGDHPLGYSILGTRVSVSVLTADDLRDLHERAYHPTQIVLAAAGNVDHEALLEALDTNGWGDIPRGRADVFAAPDPRPAEPSRRHVERDSTQTHIVFGTPTVSHADPRRYAVALASAYVGGGMSSRLFQRVREELGLAYAIQTFHSLHAQTGIHGVYVGTSPETAGKAVEAIEEELARVATNGMTEAEIRMTKDQLKGQLTISLEGPTSRMYRLAAAELYDEPFLSVDDMLQEVEGLTVDTIDAVCHELFDPAQQRVLSLGPDVAL
jgi:predicted Zn-dependent peptidase